MKTDRPLASRRVINLLQQVWRQRMNAERSLAVHALSTDTLAM